MKTNKDFSQELLSLIEDAKKKGKRYYIIPSRAMNRWRENKKAEQESDPEYEEFLKVEKQEIDEILEQLDG